MDKLNKEILKIFQIEYNKKNEEDFASMLSENPSLRLFFINENQAYTDGKNIVVDPANDNKKAIGSQYGYVNQMLPV